MNELFNIHNEYFFERIFKGLKFLFLIINIFPLMLSYEQLYVFSKFEYAACPQCL